MVESKKLFDDELIGDLVVALLSVNAWRVEKTFKIYEGLRALELLDLDAVARLDEAEVCSRLERAGYARGDFMIALLARRLLGLATALSGDGKIQLRRLVEERDMSGLERLLFRVKGIGHGVFGTYTTLRGIGDRGELK